MQPKDAKVLFSIDSEFCLKRFRSLEMSVWSFKQQYQSQVRTWSGTWMGTCNQCCTSTLEIGRPNLLLHQMWNVGFEYKGTEIVTHLDEDIIPVLQQGLYTIIVNESVNE